MTKLFNVDQVKKEQLLIDAFYRNGGSIELIESHVEGELPEFTARNMPGYLCYGNGELIIFIDDVEDPSVYFVDTYGDRKILCK
jgi:hypothetical protein